MMDIKGKIKQMPIQSKAAIGFFFAIFIQKGVSTITTPIFTRIMSTEEYGKYNVFNSWMGIVTALVTLNLYYGVYEQGLIKFEDDRKIFISSSQGLECVLVLVWLTIYTVFKDVINPRIGLSTIQVYLMFVIMWTNAVYNFWAAAQRVEYRYKSLVVLSVIVAFLQPTVSIMLIKIMEDKVVARILGIALVNVFFFTALFFIQTWNGHLFIGRYWKYALKFNIPLIPHYLSQTILISADRIMIERMDSSSSAGKYSLAYSISMVMTLFNTVLNQTIGPWALKKIKDRQEDKIVKISYMGMFILTVLNLILIDFAPEVVAFFAPDSYYGAVYVIPPVALSTVLMFAYDQFAKFEFYYEKTKMIAAATLISAMVNIILNYICIGIWGYIAAGYTTLVCYFLYSLFHYFGMKHICIRELNRCNPYNGKAMFIGFVAVLCISLVIIRFYDFLLIRVVFAIIIFEVIYRRKDLLVEMIGLVMGKGK